MKIALCQINTRVGDFEGNAAKVREFASRAAALGADAAVFPEMCLTSYPPRDLLERPGFVEANLRALESLLPSSMDLRIVVGYVDRNPSPVGKPLVNAVALLGGGRIEGKDFKSLLPTYDVFDEARYFEPPQKREPVRLCGVPAALTVCEDAWNDPRFWKRRVYDYDPVSDLVSRGARLVINVSASPFHLGKPALREEMISRSAAGLGVCVALVNQVGANDELVFDGGSFAVKADGSVALRLKPFEEDIGVFDTAGSDTAGPRVDDDVSSARRALVLGLGDYAAKCGFTDVVLGLSGGIDSALVAAIAAQALHPSRVHGVAMPSRYSSRGSIEDAEALASNLGMDFRVIPIEPAFEAFLESLAPHFAGRGPDVAEENVQARVRGVLLMALSNKFGWLTLTTGNKSETAVGYSTLYGDMCGGLAVIADVPKTLVYAIARTYPQIPHSSLTKPPSAELKPNQTDQDSLPPYEILDPILKSLIEEQMEPPDIAAAMGLDRALVEGVARMVEKSEFKRRQAAPALKITSKAFGQGRRFPIARRI